jgi:hypothetical protein
MKKDLLRGLKAFVISFVALWLLVSFITADFNPFNWTSIVRILIVIAALCLGFSFLMISDDELQNKNGSEGQESGNNNLIIPIRKPYVPPSRSETSQFGQDVENEIRKEEENEPIN